MQGTAGLVALTLIVGGGNLWSGYDQARSQARSQAQAVLAVEQRELAVQRAAQQRAAAALEVKLCTTFGRLAALKPPAGDPATNPSRAFDDNLHVTLDQLGTDFGCDHPAAASTLPGKASP
jgi:hypothetical protein